MKQEVMINFVLFLESITVIKLCINMIYVLIHVFAIYCIFHLSQIELIITLLVLKIKYRDNDIDFSDTTKKLRQTWMNRPSSGIFGVVFI
jgi:hypothetical protein